MRRVAVYEGDLELTDKVIAIIEKRVTKFGKGAKVDCPKEYLGKRVYLLITND